MRYAGGILITDQRDGGPLTPFLSLFLTGPLKHQATSALKQELRGEVDVTYH